MGAAGAYNLRTRSGLRVALTAFRLGRVSERLDLSGRNDQEVTRRSGDLAGGRYECHGPLQLGQQRVAMQNRRELLPFVTKNSSS